MSFSIMVTGTPLRWGIPSLPVLSPASSRSVRLPGFYTVSPHSSSVVYASTNNVENSTEDARKPTKDTRIHWGSSEDGWLGTPSSPPEPSSEDDAESVSASRNGRGDNLMGLLNLANDSHYRYLELTPDAEADEIKAAYRRLSKTYHPDTTSLPLEQAAAKFVRLKEAYTVLSDEQERRFYDWQLAQEISRKQGGRFIWPYEVGQTSDDDSVPKVRVRSDEYLDPVDRLGGRNMELSGQAQMALAFDMFAVFVSILSIIYALYFKRA